MSLLDKASLVQIPSGYKATKLYSVVPDSGAGDFDFSRSSSATRVNSEGLIETPSVLGDELVTNGDFNTNSDWILASGATISDGKLNLNVGGGNGAYQVVTFTAQTTSKVVVVCSEYVSGSLQVRAGTTSNTETISGVGTYTYYLPYASYPYVNFFSSGGFEGKIDSITVKELVENDVPRLDYSGGASCPTLLLEPQRTNQQTHSEDLTNPFWATSNVSVVANQTTSPDGNQTADKVDYGAGSGFIRNLVTITSPATTFSIFIKYFDFQFIQIMTSGDVNHYANFDVQNGVLGNVGSSTEAEIEDYGNGWYRIVAKFVSGTFAGQPRLYKITSETSGWASGGGDAGSFYMWGGQQEVAAFQTSYIPTTSSTVTRTADFCNNAGTSATFNST